VTEFVLVPGANHGGWWYQPVVARLEAAGHAARAITLRGLDPEAPSDLPAATLDDHVAELRAAIDAVDPGEPLVLVGHSYGGAVINGAVDDRPERVAATVYLDALLPDDGDSCWSLTNDWEREWYVDGSRRTGAFVDPLPFFDERARPHPLASLMQAARLQGGWRRLAGRVYVEALDWPDESPLRTSADKVRHDPAVRFLQWDTTHNVLREGPDRLVELLLEVAAELRS
jgi:pimeloyl-ACP methyl ester carboxylesterase